jgi:hypothetical protein
VLGGAEAFDRLCEMVPIVVDLLIKYGCVDSNRTESVEEPRDREDKILDARGEGGLSDGALLCSSMGEGNAGRGESRFASLGVSGSKLAIFNSVPFSYPK